MKVEIISGSPRINSVTRRVAIHLKNILKHQFQIDAGLIDMQLHSLPPVENLFRQAEDAPAEIRNVAARIFAADAFILVTPEYNGSYSPALKNFLDHFPKQERKVFGIVTASPGALGGIRAALQLQTLIFGLFGIGSPKMLITPQVEKKLDDKGNLLDPAFKASVDTFLEEFIWLSDAVTASKMVNERRRVA